MSVAGRTQDRESSPIKDQRSTTVYHATMRPFVAHSTSCMCKMENKYLMLLGVPV